MFALLILLVAVSGEVQTHAAPFQTQAECTAKLVEVKAAAARAGAILYAAGCAPVLPTQDL